MQMKSRVLHFFLILLLGFFGIIGLLLLEVFTYEAPVADLLVPKQADWIMRVDPEQLVKDETYSLLFQAKDDQLIAQLRKIAEERVEKTTKNGSLTIDFRQQVVLFGSHKDTNAFTGIVLQVIDPAVFRANISRYLDPGQTFAIRGTTALILTQQNETPLPKKARQLLAESYLNNSVRQPEHATVKQPFLTVEVPLWGKEHGSLYMAVHHELHALELNGSFQSDTDFPTANYTLKSSGLFISTSIIPAGFSDSINHLLPLGNFHFPELQAITLDYNGLTVEQTSQGVLALPHMNLILETVRPLSIDSIFAAVPKDMIGRNQTIVMASVTYQVKQLDQNTIFIGLDTNTIQHQKQTALSTVKGSLGSLAKISGSQFMMAILDVIPTVRASKDFVKRTQSIDFSIRPDGKQYRVKGRILFSNNAYALHETVKLLLGINFLQ